MYHSMLVCSRRYRARELSFTAILSNIGYATQPSCFSQKTKEHGWQSWSGFSFCCSGAAFGRLRCAAGFRWDITMVKMKNLGSTPGKTVWKTKDDLQSWKMQAISSGENVPVPDDVAIFLFFFWFDCLVVKLDLWPYIAHGNEGATD